MLHINEEMYYNSKIFAIPLTKKTQFIFSHRADFPLFSVVFTKISPFQLHISFPTVIYPPPPNLIFNPAYQYNEKLPVYLQKSFIE